MTSRLPRAALVVLALSLARGAAAEPTGNGTDLNGTNLNGVVLDGGDLGGTRLDVRLEGSELVATRWNGTTVRGDELVGAKLAGVTVGGLEVTIRLDAYALTGDLALYTVSYREPHATGPWVAVCPGGTPAVALAGVWEDDGSKTRDPGMFTLACPGGALRKCIDLGYAPWRELGGASLEPAHQACTRALRADYCGTGSPYTQDGFLINIHDRMGLQVDTEEWTPEAEWGEDGAACLSGTATRASVPVACAEEKLDAACGQPDHVAPGSLLVTELP